MYRKVEDYLLSWKQNDNHLPLLIKGARQVGKSYSIRKFAKANYEHVIEINFELDMYMKEVFEQTRKVEDIIAMYQLQHPETIFDQNTLLFLDEIQSSSSALTSLKFFANQDFDVIASGSLLGVSIAHTTSFPVGYVEMVDLHAMDFEEFLIANQIPEAIFKQLKECYEKGTMVMEPLHKKMMQLFKEYIVVGGMPAVVKEYITSKNFDKVKQLQQQILNAYYADIAKYGEGSEKIKAHECFTSIPKQLAKDNKKFQYKLLKKGGNARIYESSLQWLFDSGLIHRLYRLDTLEEPMEAHIDLSAFKVYFHDTGLLLAMFEQNVGAMILQDDLLIYKGGIFENVVYQCLQAHHKNIYYYEYRSQYEIDFVIYENDRVVPIEVKSAGNTKSKSLQASMERFHLQKGYKLSTNNTNVNEKIKCYPLYMLLFI